MFVRICRIRSWACARTARNTARHLWLTGSHQRPANRRSKSSISIQRRSMYSISSRAQCSRSSARSRSISAKATAALPRPTTPAAGAVSPAVLWSVSRRWRNRAWPEKAALQSGSGQPTALQAGTGLGRRLQPAQAKQELSTLDARHCCRSASCRCSNPVALRLPLTWPAIFRTPLIAFAFHRSVPPPALTFGDAGHRNESAIAYRDQMRCAQIPGTCLLDRGTPALLSKRGVQLIRVIASPAT